MIINKRLLDLVEESKKYIALQVLVNWISLLCNMAALISICLLLQRTLEGQPLRPAITAVVVIVAAALGLRFVCRQTEARLSYLTSVKVKRILRQKIYEKLLRLGVSYTEKAATAEVVQVSVEGVEQLEAYFGKYLPQFFYSLLAPVTLFIALSLISFKSALVLLACVPLIPLSMLATQWSEKKLFQKYWGLYLNLGNRFLENLQGLTTLKIYRADEHKNQEMNRAAENFRKITMKVLAVQLNSVAVMDLIAFGGAALGIMISVGEWLQGRISFGGAFAIILLAAEFFIPIRLLGSFFHIAMNGVAASDKIFRILDLKEDASPQGRIAHTDISIENLSFSYEPAREILRGVSMEIPRGSFISLVGESGCGKSTVASLIMGLRKGYSGRLTIGGKELRDLSEKDVMRHITLVDHNSYIFKGTIEDNLKMGNPDATPEQMWNALGQVKLDDFVASQKGLLTKLQERGANLSGGQRQRLALARALLHDSEIYIFDEATSNIDVENEKIIMSVIGALAGNKTVLFISHRLANVVASDCIYVLEQGRVAEQGTHRELCDRDGIYARLYHSQQRIEQYAGRAIYA